MSREIYIRILKPVPDSFRVSRPFTSEEVSKAGLAHEYDQTLIDDYHIKITELSVYASMKDIGSYLQSKFPDTDFTNWAMKPLGGRHGGYHCHGAGWSYNLSADERKSLEKQHSMECVVTLPKNCWSFPAYKAEWLKEHCPIYLTNETLPKLLASYQKSLTEEELNELDWYMDETVSLGIFDKLCQASAYAQLIGGAAIVEWE